MTKRYKWSDYDFSSECFEITSDKQDKFVGTAYEANDGSERWFAAYASDKGKPLTPIGGSKTPTAFKSLDEAKENLEIYLEQVEFLERAGLRSEEQKEETSRPEPPPRAALYFCDCVTAGGSTKCPHLLEDENAVVYVSVCRAKECERIVAAFNTAFAGANNRAELFKTCPYRNRS